MIHAGTEDLIKKYNMSSFSVQALSVERTLCEKIMGLVRFSHVENREMILSSKVRHIYDLHLMLKNEKISSFFNEDDFIRMIVKVGDDDFIGYKNNNEWLKDHPGSAAIFDSPEKVWQHIMDAYQGSFKQMVYGELPSESDLLDTLSKIGTRIKPIDWQVGR